MFLKNDPTAAEVIKAIKILTEVKGEDTLVIVFDGRTFEERHIAGITYDVEKNKVEIWIKEH